MTLQQTFRPGLGVFAALVLASAASAMLVAVRVAHTRRLAYAFLVWNLILAWIPLGLAVVAQALDAWRSRRKATAAGVVCLLAWLVFLPNAPYIVTDLMHLRVQGNRLLWLDLVMLQAFAWTGLAVGFVSLEIVQRWVARRVGTLGSWVFVATAIGLSAFGIYLGRFHRWNSWDVARNPLGLASDIARMVLNPFGHTHVVLFSAAMGGFLLTAYLVVQALSLRPSSDR